MCTMRQNIQSTRTSEDAFADTQWGKDALHCDYSPIQVRDLKAHNTLWEHVNHIFFHTLMRKYNLTDLLSCTSNNLIYM